MILLDTNVVSEAMRVSPDREVIAWLNATETTTLFLSVVTVAEISYGIEMLPDGRRRDSIAGRFADFVDRGFRNRLLDFDRLAAYAYGNIMAGRRRVGRPMSVPDGQIAAIAVANRCSIATRDMRGFEGLAVELINPWKH